MRGSSHLRHTRPQLRHSPPSPSYPCLPRVSRRQHHQGRAHSPQLRHRRAYLPRHSRPQLRHTRARHGYLAATSTNAAHSHQLRHRRALPLPSFPPPTPSYPCLPRVSRHHQHPSPRTATNSTIAAPYPPSLPPPTPSYPCLPRVSRHHQHPSPRTATNSAIAAPTSPFIPAPNSVIPVLATGISPSTPPRPRAQPPTPPSPRLPPPSFPPPTPSYPCLPRVSRRHTTKPSRKAPNSAIAAPTSPVIPAPDSVIPVLATGMTKRRGAGMARSASAGVRG